jgi:hypothetical protein
MAKFDGRLAGIVPVPKDVKYVVGLIQETHKHINERRKRSIETLGSIEKSDSGIGGDQNRRFFEPALLLAL